MLNSLQPVPYLICDSDSPIVISVSFHFQAHSLWTELLPLSYLVPYSSCLICLLKIVSSNHPSRSDMPAVLAAVPEYANVHDGAPTLMF